MKDLIEEICISEGVYESEPILKKRYKMINDYNKYIEKYNDGEVALIGSYNNVMAVYNISYERNKSKLYIDKSSRKINTEIIRKCKLIIECDYVALSFFSVSKRLTTAVFNRCSVINFYKFIDDKEYDKGKSWIQAYSYGYFELNDSYRLFKKADNNIDKAKYAERLIAGTLYIRDFLDAEKLINYIGSLETSGDRINLCINYNELWKKISQKLDELKTKLHNRKHVVVNWIDALRYDEIDNMDYVSEKVHSGIFFERMYSETSYTKAAMITLLTGNKLIDDKGYERDVYHLDCREIDLLRILKENNYEFRCFSEKFAGDFFDKYASTFPYIQHSERGVKFEHAITPSTIMQYMAILDMAETQENELVIIHNLPETHPPFVNPWDYNTYIDDFHVEPEDDKHDIRLATVEESQKFLDMQLRYYSQYYDSNLFTIYLSDHGKYLGEKCYDIENYNHILFGIQGKGLKAQNIKKVHGLAEFKNIVQALFDNELEKYMNKCSNMAWIIRDDVYGKLASFYDGKNKEFEDYIIQHRGVVTSEDWYILYVTGKEKYVSYSDKYVDEHVENERIQQLKTIVGKQFIDIYNTPKYAKAVNIYEQYGWKRAEDNEYV